MSRATVPVRVPGTLEQALSPEWLTAALGERFPGVRVTRVVPGAVDARVSTNAALSIECEGGLPDGLPPDLWVKGYFGEEGHAARYVGAVEASFYAELAGRTGIRTLRTVFAAVDPQASSGIVITADVGLEGGRFLDPRSPYSPDNVAEGLAQLATLHAATWCAPAWRDVPWLAPRIATIIHGRASVVPDCLASPVADGVPDRVRDPQRLVDACLAVAAKAAAADPWVVMHGDTHLGNVFLDGTGRPCFLDWQLVQRGAWGIDVGYHIASTLPVEERRRSERDLLDHYLQQLAAAGAPAPSRDEAWVAVRRGIVYGFFLWSITLRVDPTVTAVMLERLGSAADDHDALAVGL